MIMGLITKRFQQNAELRETRSFNMIYKISSFYSKGKKVSTQNGKISTILKALIFTEKYSEWSWGGNWHWQKHSCSTKEINPGCLLLNKQNLVGWLLRAP